MGMGLEKLNSGAVKRVKNSENVPTKQENLGDADKKIKEKLAAEIKSFQKNRDAAYPYAEKEKSVEVEAEIKEFYKKRSAEKINN